MENKIKENKDILDYYIEYKNFCDRYSKILIKTENQSIYIKLDPNFFVHMIGIQKIAYYKNKNITSILQEIKKGKVTFLHILEILKKSNIDYFDKRCIKNKLMGLKHLTFSENFFYGIKNIIINSKGKIHNKINQDFILLLPELSQLIDSKNTKICWYLTLKKFDKKYPKLDNYCFISSFIFIYFYKDIEKLDKIKITKDNKVISEIKFIKKTNLK